MSKIEEQYDASDRTMRVYRAFDEPMSLVPQDELRRWSYALKQGTTDEGKPLEKVHYVFADPRSAEYNHQPLSFMGIETWVGDKSKRSPWAGEDGTPSFSTREDFGID